MESENSELHDRWRFVESELHIDQLSKDSSSRESHLLTATSSSDDCDIPNQMKAVDPDLLSDSSSANDLRLECSVFPNQNDVSLSRDRPSDTGFCTVEEHKALETVISHLQLDNVRLEAELITAHNRIGALQNELKERLKIHENLEFAMKEVLTQNNSLLSEISRVRISASYPEGQEALRIAVLEEKLAEYQQSSAEIQGQLVDEIRTLETKLSISEKSEKENVLRIEQLENSVEEWRKRFENVSHENETLIRSNEEVKHLELAIRENSEEKEKLYQELAKLMEERRQLTASRDHLSSQLEEAQLEITRLREKTKNNNESRTQNAMKYVALENEVRRLKAELESLSVESAEGAKNSEMDNSKKKKACDEGEVVLLSHNFSSDSSRTRSNLKEHVSISGSQKARNVLHRVGRSLKLLPYRRTSCVPYSYVRFLFLTYIMFIHVAFFFCLYH